MKTEPQINYIVDFKGDLIPCNNLIEVLYLFGVSISNTGEITYDKTQNTIPYDMHSFTPETALLDFAKNRLPELVTIYKVTKL